MPTNTLSNRDHRTPALVLRRVNYGEADRIVDFLTPAGLVATIAKGVRREKAKLAGGIELFCLSEITYHEGKPGNLATLTSAKMQIFYQNILTDFAKMEFASRALKQTAKAARDVDSPELFTLLKSVYEGLSDNLPQPLVEIYFALNLDQILGEPINLYFDADGQKLRPGLKYYWDASASALVPNPAGPISADDIKLLRLILTSSLKLVSRVNYPFCDIIEKWKIL